MKSVLPILAISLLVFPALSRAEDLSNRFGVSAILGAGFPVGPKEITSQTPSAGFNTGILASFYVGPQFGMGVSYENLHLGGDQWVSPIDVLLLYRMFPDRSWTPTLQVGAGSAKSVNSTRMENMNVKTNLGVDYFLTPSVAVGPQLSYTFISHTGDAPTDVHLIGVNLLASYYFGSTY